MHSLFMCEREATSIFPSVILTQICEIQNFLVVLCMQTRRFKYRYIIITNHVSIVVSLRSSPITMENILVSDVRKTPKWGTYLSEGIKPEER